MKKNIKFAFVAFALAAFTACGNDSDTATDTTETVDTDVNMDMETDMDADSTIVVEDTTVKDGVVDEIKEEQP